jgi:hypothetical protein
MLSKTHAEDSRARGKTERQANAAEARRGYHS